MAMVWALRLAQRYSSHLCPTARPPCDLRWPWQISANEWCSPAYTKESLRRLKTICTGVWAPPLDHLNLIPGWGLDNSDGQWGLTQTHPSQALFSIHEVCAKGCWELHCHWEDWEGSSRAERTNTFRAGPQINGWSGCLHLGSVSPAVVRKIIMRKPANWGNRDYPGSWSW